MSDQVTFNFYLGLLAFRDENYKKADEHLEFALKHCHRGAKRNERVILEYLVPIKMLKGIMPSEALFKRHTELEKTYDPFVAAIRSGNVGAYDQSLVKHQNYLLRRGTYLIMEHIREISIRTLFYKVYVLGGENSRMPIPLFKEALKLADIDVETAEVECILANMIYSNYIKGYLSHQHLMLVLRKQQPFPKVSTTTATIVN
ncbi:COP9 signalosome (CSN) subunit [Spiromyces aspiralis]|uniref:COP9 signalosome (CSN) subunit n=1 Tax=Spiromyces aspiralis TaxID=68401 RepID=A0ACC1HPA9_9FUNG|nr:COP9 signalosome (CSN) subunit [Spiromyces aspiralis]